MEEESANWCRFALLIIDEGGNVLKRLFRLQCLTSIFVHYSSRWIQELDDLESKVTQTLWRNFRDCLSNSTQSGQHVLENLLQLWTPPEDTHITWMEDIDTLEQWKKDIENELDKNVRDGVKTTLNSWTSEIQQELDKLNSMYTILRRWDTTFLDNLLIAQVHLQVEIENHEQFPHMCVNKLKSLNYPSSPEFQHVIQNLKCNLETWKSNCITVLQSFEVKCKSFVQLWQNEAEGSDVMVQFLANIKDAFSTECNAQSLIDRFYGKHYQELEDLFKAYAKKASKSDSRSEISDLIGQLRIDLARVHSFKNIKFTDSIDKIKKNSAPPNLTENNESKLDVILRTGDLATADNSLLIILVEKTNLIHFKFQDRDEDLPDQDISISADLLRLRSYRNRIVAHTAQGKIPSKLFEKFWKEAKEAICRIASRCGKDFETSISNEIDQKKECPLEAGREVTLRETIVEWCRKDFLTQLSARSPASSTFLSTFKSMQNAQVNVIGSREAQTVYVCKTCDVEFSQKAFAKHKCIQAPRGYICGKCKAAFSTEENWSNHKCNQASEHYMCGKCRHVSTKEDFKNHACSVAPERVKCNGCREEFSTAKGFQEHKCIQAPRGHGCDKCKKEFSTEMELTKHKCPQDNIIPAITAAVVSGACQGAIFGPIGAVVGGAGGFIGGLVGGWFAQR